MNSGLPEKLILLADDDPDDAEIFGEALADVDPTVKFYHVTDGMAVFECLERIKQIPNVIFLDINMPEMSGWQCLTRLKSNLLTRNIPIVIYSTSSHPRDRQTALDLGATAFITKPSDYKSLQKMLFTVIHNLHRDIESIIKKLQ